MAQYAHEGPPRRGASRPDPLRWLVNEWQWPYATAFAACFLLALTPIVWSGLGVAAMLIYVQLPVYMLHQLEEHGGDRFRRYVNVRLAGGSEVLTRPLAFAVNLLAVWVLMVAAFLLAYYVNPALGLVAVYLTAANALVHVVVAIDTRAYNPGLVTAVALFAPLAAWATVEVNRSYGVSGGVQLLAIAIAVLGHLAIVAVLGARRLRR